MSLSVFTAAEHLGKASKWTLSNLKIQKLLYIAHMFHLGREGLPLVKGQFEAWDYGPVYPSLYHSLKIFGSNPVKKFIFAQNDETISESDPRAVLIKEVCEALSEEKPGKLVAITHWNDGAWAKNYKPGARGIPIPNEDIQREYHDRFTVK